MPHPSCRQICAPAPRRLSARLARRRCRCRRRRRRRHSRRRRLPALRPRLTAAVSPPINQNHCVNWHLVMHRFPTTDDIATATGSYILHLPCRRHRPPPPSNAYTHRVPNLCCVPSPPPCVLPAVQQTGRLISHYLRNLRRAGASAKVGPGGLQPFQSRRLSTIIHDVFIPNIIELSWYIYVNQIYGDCTTSFSHFAATEFIVSGKSHAIYQSGCACMLKC